MSVCVRQNLRQVLDRINVAYLASPEAMRAMQVPRLVAVSKTQSHEKVLQAYDEGQRHFGENYVAELLDKANHPDILTRCPDIQWHFIGTLQSNKVPKMLHIPRLTVIETLVSAKVADRLNAVWDSQQQDARLQVMIQVNTSSEDNKSGVQPELAVQLAQHITDHCPKLELIGLMTIGDLGQSQLSAHRAPADLLEQGNPDFQRLVLCRRSVAQALHRDEKNLELSMGMSTDFEEAIRMGSTSVRVGSSIFGSRAVANPD